MCGSGCRLLDDTYASQSPVTIGHEFEARVVPAGAESFPEDGHTAIGIEESVAVPGRGAIGPLLVQLSRSVGGEVPVWEVGSPRSSWFGRRGAGPMPILPARPPPDPAAPTLARRSGRMPASYVEGLMVSSDPRAQRLRSIRRFVREGFSREGNRCQCP